MFQNAANLSSIWSSLEKFEIVCSSVKFFDWYDSDIIVLKLLFCRVGHYLVNIIFQTQIRSKKAEMLKFELAGFTFSECLKYIY